jgi:hypothetical protein
VVLVKRDGYGIEGNGHEASRASAEGRCTVEEEGQEKLKNAWTEGLVISRHSYSGILEHIEIRHDWWDTNYLRGGKPFLSN